MLQSQDSRGAAMLVSPVSAELSDEFFFSLITGDRDLSDYAGAAVGAVARANEQRWILTELGRLENVTKLGKVEFLIILEYLSRILIKKFFYHQRIY